MSFKGVLSCVDVTLGWWSGVKVWCDEMMIRGIKKKQKTRIVGVLHGTIYYGL
jgi:hypothetical protein